MSLTPLEWFEEQAIAKAQRDAQRRDLASQEGTKICMYFGIQSVDASVFLFFSFYSMYFRIQANTCLNTTKNYYTTFN